MRLLIIDDSAYVRQSLVSRLSGITGIDNIHEAEEPEEALSLLMELKPGLVILDIAFQSGSGMDLLGKIRAISPMAIIMVLSLYSDAFYRDACIAAGADFFFDKCIESEKAVETVRLLTDGHNDSRRESCSQE